MKLESQYMYPNKKNEFAMTKSMFISIEKETSILRKMVERKLFLRNQSINIIYPNYENEFMVPNHEKKRDYYENPSLF